MSRLFSGKCVAAGPDFWVALSPTNVWALPIRQIYSTWTDTPSGSPPLSRLASFESGWWWWWWELLLSANLHTRGELVIQIYSRLILLPKKWGALFELAMGDCMKTARRVLGGPSEVRFSVCQSILKRYYWHCLVQYLWARCERSERYVALRDFPTPPGLQIEVNLYSCHLHLSPPLLLLLLLLFPALWTPPAREFLFKPHSATQVGQSALASRIKVVYSLARRRAKGDNIAARVLRRFALRSGQRRSPHTSLPDRRQRRPPKPGRRIPFLQIVIKRE